MTDARLRPGPHVRALRPHQWGKNLLVFLPVLGGHRFEADILWQATLALAAFCLVASGVYVVNDILDISADRAHPRKRTRPFAAGLIPVARGIWMAGGLFLAGGLLALLQGPGFFGMILAYMLLTTAYSIRLKKYAVIDIVVLAGLYTIRIVAGGVATDIPPSTWLLAFSLFFFLALAAVKRQAELVDITGRGVKNTAGRGYSDHDLPVISMISIAAGYVSVLVLALYIESAAVSGLYGRPELLWGGCAVLLYWITRTVLITHRGLMHDDPIVFAARDGASRICGLLIAACVLAAAHV
ncbi:UbiA family prenyltransferase [Palleronia abyssalis]|uniref:Decaprenyl-phosphate phosphoribosyltransferase n=1 Tax=Palleronia abyssalis TaxID=1501240 RepID=A0A2R8BZ96_9RHOB|nr:UbiA family prenyltransferase [Palleronia abyssalis]SPJ25497.1 Decaprenyl-phosphate phosphoribosyltransferase [Palleronia abyssalis]